VGKRWSLIWSRIFGDVSHICPDAGGQAFGFTDWGRAVIGTFALSVATASVAALAAIAVAAAFFARDPLCISIRVAIRGGVDRRSGGCIWGGPVSGGCGRLAEVAVARIDRCALSEGAGHWHFF